jgi:hypothetical protein
LKFQNFDIWQFFKFEILKNQQFFTFEILKIQQFFKFKFEISKKKTGFTAIFNQTAFYFFTAHNSQQLFFISHNPQQLGWAF